MLSEALGVKKFNIPLFIVAGANVSCEFMGTKLTVPLILSAKFLHTIPNELEGTVSTSTRGGGTN